MWRNPNGIVLHITKRWPLPVAQQQFSCFAVVKRIHRFVALFIAQRSLFSVKRRMAFGHINKRRNCTICRGRGSWISRAWHFHFSLFKFSIFGETPSAWILNENMCRSAENRKCPENIWMGFHSMGDDGFIALQSHNLGIVMIWWQPFAHSLWIIIISVDKSRREARRIESGLMPHTWFYEIIHCRSLCVCVLRFPHPASNADHDKIVVWNQKHGISAVLLSTLLPSLSSFDAYECYDGINGIYDYSSCEQCAGYDWTMSRNPGDVLSDYHFAHGKRNKANNRCRA